jgi:hypothetical protein
MSVYLSTGTVNDNLALSLDMDNRRYGFVGAPTSNVQSETGLGVYNNAGANISHSLSVVPNQFYRGARVWRQIMTPVTATGVNNLTGGANPGVGIVHSGGGQLANVVAGHSIFFKPTVLMHSVPLYTGYSNIGGYGFGVGDNYVEDMGDGWFRGVGMRSSTTTQTDGKYWAINPLRAVLNQPITIFWAGPFREDQNYQNFVSDFTTGARTNNQCLRDFTGTHTNVSVENMNYAFRTGNLLDFNGSTNRIGSLGVPSSVNPATNSIDRTWEVVVRTTNSGATQGVFGHKVGDGCSYYCNGGIYIINGNFAFNWFDNSAYQFMTSGVAATNNQYFHVVGTYTASDQRNRIYVNGVLRNTSGVTNMNYLSNHGLYVIGRNYFTSSNANIFTGRVPIVSWYYNKSLSASEVQQNYLAFKSTILRI